MDREIKFRFWHKELTGYNNKIYPAGFDNYVFIGFDGKLCENDYGLCELDRNQYIIQQFTNLKDKNGKEIYEGDIVKFVTKVDHGDAENHIGEVWFDSNYGIWTFGKWWADNTPTKYIDGKWIITGEKSGYWCGFSMLDNTLCDNTLEIIGNINENPELLNK